jgi:hypothetical protein
MTQHLHLVFGGELDDPQTVRFRDPSRLHIVGIFPDYESAHAAWKAEAQRTVDNAHMRYFIADLSRLLDGSDPPADAPGRDAPGGGPAWRDPRG